MWSSRTFTILLIKPDLKRFSKLFLNLNQSVKFSPEASRVAEDNHGGRQVAPEARGGHEANI